MILDFPNGKAGILSPEMSEREKVKFIQTMEEARELAIRSLREEFGRMISRITERFSNGSGDKPKIFKNGTVNNFYAFFETFKERDIFQDDQLAELLDRAESILGGHSAESIRSNDHLKERIREDHGLEPIRIRYYLLVLTGILTPALVFAEKSFHFFITESIICGTQFLILVYTVMTERKRMFQTIKHLYGLKQEI